jgi:hypothetical protein
MLKYKKKLVTVASVASRNVLNDISVLKNPLESLSLNPSRDLVYGILGIVASVVGFLIWSFIIGPSFKIYSIAFLDLAV